MKVVVDNRTIHPVIIWYEDHWRSISHPNCFAGICKRTVWQRCNNYNKTSQSVPASLSSSAFWKKEHIHKNQHITSKNSGSKRFLPHFVDWGFPDSQQPPIKPPRFSLSSTSTTTSETPSPSASVTPLVTLPPATLSSFSNLGKSENSRYTQPTPIGLEGAFYKVY